MKNETELRYKFGKNWQVFLDSSFDMERVNVSRNHMLEFLKLKNLDDKVFLDIGCGSGIHSLAAILSGAKKVISFDFDSNSVKATEKLKRSIDSPENWLISQGSVLDVDFMNALEKADIVYSWGVLHHTGAMWDAIKNSIIPLKKDGVYYIALYAYEVYQNPSPEYWLDIKRKYNLASNEEKEKLEYWYAWERVLKNQVINGENPFDIIKDYKKNRGMEFWTDVRDWLGGYPMEFAKTRDVSKFALNSLDLEIIDIKTGEGNTEYIMSRADADNNIQKIINSCIDIQLLPDFKRHEGHCYIAELPKLNAIADSNDDHFKSPVMLYEDGEMVTYPHARHAYISKNGEGSFSHWGKNILFSSSDNSDPNTNGRVYSIKVPEIYLC